MDVKTFRAANMQAALSLVRHELGPDAAVLHTREVSGGLLQWISGRRSVEITATTDVTAPRRLAARRPMAELAPFKAANIQGLDLAQLSATSATPTFEDDRARLRSMIAELHPSTARGIQKDMPEAFFRLFTDLIEADFHEDLARTLIEQLRNVLPERHAAESPDLKNHLARMIEDEIHVTGPIRTQPGQRRLIALVGPTGVGKTTTIAKLAANFRLKQKRRVGLITVDTFRVAAVEQLRTYADIIDLPMEVVSTPAEMRQAMVRLADLDLVLMDTAGRSPRDDVKIQELKTMLAEARPDEVHLVLSATGGLTSLVKAAERFASVGTTTLLLTKLDEAVGIGNLLPLMRGSRLPLSYLTNGQNVPDDIEIADSFRLARMMLGMELSHR